MTSDCLWPELAGAVNDNHQVNDSVAICGPGPSVWTGSVSACAPVRQGRRNRPAFQPQPSPVSENSYPAHGQTSSLPLLPAQSYHLRLGEDLSKPTHRVYNSKNEPKCGLLALGDNDASMFTGLQPMYHSGENVSGEGHCVYIG